MSLVEANDIFSELKVLEISLPNVLTSSFEILEFIKVKYYYLNYCEFRTQISNFTPMKFRFVEQVSMATTNNQN